MDPDPEQIARGWLCDPDGNPETAPLRHAIRLLLDRAEALVESLGNALLEQGALWDLVADDVNYLDGTLLQGLAVAPASCHRKERSVRTFTVDRNREFARDILSVDRLLDEVVDWIGVSLEPDDVFEDSALEAWAEDNGYVREEGEKNA